VVPAYRTNQSGQRVLVAFGPDVVSMGERDIIDGQGLVPAPDEPHSAGDDQHASQQ
jgi:hypothetical protein